MSAPTLAERTAIRVTAGMVVLVSMGTLVGFWLSYAGLHSFALHAGLRGPEAWAWPISVDLFIAVGECGVFIAALRRRKLTEDAAPWVYLVLGFGASVTANVLHVDTAALPWIPYAAAAVPPVAAMLALAALLRHVYTWAEANAEAPAAAAARPRSHRAESTPATRPPAPPRSGRLAAASSPRPLVSLPRNPTPEAIAAAAALVDPPVTGRKLGEVTGRPERTARRWLEQAELVPAID